MGTCCHESHRQPALPEWTPLPLGHLEHTNPGTRACRSWSIRSSSLRELRQISEGVATEDGQATVRQVRGRKELQRSVDFLHPVRELGLQGTIDRFASDVGEELVEDDDVELAHVTLDGVGNKGAVHFHRIRRPFAPGHDAARGRTGERVPVRHADSLRGRMDREARPRHPHLGRCRVLRCRASRSRADGGRRQGREEHFSEDS